jgi:hypothetical protein
MNLATDDRASPVAASIRDGMLWVTLQDGRVVGTPLDWYPFLEGISEQHLSNIELKWNAVWWPDLGEGLSIEGMLKGVNPREEMMAVVETA